MGRSGLDGLVWGPRSSFWASYAAGSQPHSVSCFSLEGEEDQVKKKKSSAGDFEGGRACLLVNSF